MPPSVRTLDQILSELGTVYDPQIKSLQQRQSLIPGQIAEEEKGLDAKKTVAFDSILNGARRRGTGVAFGGIPLAEQAQYTASEYLPAVARLRQAGRDQAMSLQDAILGIQERRQNTALQQRQYEQSRYDQWQANERQLEAQRRAAAQQAATFGNLFGPTQQPTPPAARMEHTEKGFSFYDATGKPITAAQFAPFAGKGYRKLLSDMARAGDKNAQIALKYVGNDAKFGNAPEQYRAALSALGATGTFATKPVSRPKNPLPYTRPANIFSRRVSA